MKEYKKNKTNPISAGSWLLAAGSYFRKTNPISPFFSKFQGSSKHVYLHSCILAYLFFQNDPNSFWLPAVRCLL
jgi:hypothetical protein